LENTDQTNKEKVRRQRGCSSPNEEGKKEGTWPVKGRYEAAIRRRMVKKESIRRKDSGMFLREIIQRGEGREWGKRMSPNQREAYWFTNNNQGGTTAESGDRAPESGGDEKLGKNRFAGR